MSPLLGEARRLGEHFPPNTLRLSVATGSTLWYCGCVLYQVFRYGDSLVPSLLWRFSVLGCLLSWILFAVNVMASGRLRSTSLKGLAFVFVFFIISALVSVTVAPQLGYWAFAERYDIVYFDSYKFAFPSGMILLLSLTALVIGFNARVSGGHRADPGVLMRRSKYGLELAAQNVAVYSSIIFWEDLIQYALRSSSQYVRFSILMIVVMIIPVLQPAILRLTKRDRELLSAAGIATSFSLLAIMKLVFDLPTWPPSLSFAAFAFLLVCISSPLGYLGALAIDLRSLRYEWTTSLLTLSTSSFICVILGYATWFYCHAAVSVTLFQNVTIG
jgi:hypothetical protein